MRIARKYDLHVIEDACESVGGESTKVGRSEHSEISVFFAFYPNKTDDHR